MHCNNKFRITENLIAVEGRKALFAMSLNAKPFYINVETLLSLFDSSAAMMGAFLIVDRKSWDIVELR